MPYKDNKDLPDNVRGVLPADAQDVWRSVFNDTEERHGDEGRAAATAWTAVGNGWRKTPEGNWVRKADASTPAPPEDRRTGSERNPAGSASSDRGGIDIDATTERTLSGKVAEHNEEHGDVAGKRATLGMLKAVYRRGAGAFSTSHRPGMTRNQWAMGRVNAFLRLLRTGAPENAAYVSDNDLLPREHRRSTRKVEKAESYSPPEAVRAAARRGLELREKWGRGGLTTQEAGEQGIGSGVARARDLAAGKGVSAETIRRMVAFFSRHEQNKDSVDDDGGPGAGQIAWLLWGGDPGRRWAERIDAQLDEEEEVEKTGTWSRDLEIRKVDGDRHLVFGWANVAIRKDGEQIEDSQADIVDPADLEDAAYQFNLAFRKTGEMHEGEAKGDLIESFVVTEEKLQKMGLPPDALPQGWWVGFYIPSDEVFAKVKDGTYQMFSIQGRAVREEVD